MQNEYGKRLSLFIERVCKMNQKEFADTVNAQLKKDYPSGTKEFSRSDITKYIQGTLNIPTLLLKVMHKIWHLNYEWHFEGTGPLQTDRSNQRKLTQDVTDILASVSVIEYNQNKMQKTINGLFERLRKLEHAGDTTGTR